MNGISVVIPTYNEATAIAGLVETVIAELGPSEIIIVDDDSPDQTWQVVERLAAEDKRIRCIRRRSARGLTASLREGIAAATGEYIFWFDADFRPLPGILAAMAEAGRSHDIVVASRYIEGGRDSRRETLRVVTSRIFNRAARFILRTRSRDLTSGQTVARSNVFSRLQLRGNYGEYSIRFLFEAERKGLTVKEIPYEALSRKSGGSKSAASFAGFIGHGFRYALTVAQIKLWKR